MSMDKKTTIALVILVIVVIAGGVLIALPSKSNQKEENTNTETSFVSPNVRVQLPYPGANVLKQFKVSGEARGTWYFEASFPVEVQDKEGNVIGHGIAQALEDWMTEEFVPFEAPISIEGNYSGPATLILKKDNPSGLPEHEDSVSFPINIL